MSDYPKPFNVDSLGFLEHSAVLVKLIAVGFLITTLTIFYFQWAKLNSRLSKGKRLRISFSRLANFYRNYSKNSYLLSNPNLIMAFFLLFFQINQNLISSNIKTNEVRTFKKLKNY